MSVNTSDEYLDELLQAIEPIIYPDGRETEEETQADLVMEPMVEMSVDSEPELTVDETTEISMESQEEALVENIELFDVESMVLDSTSNDSGDSMEIEMGESQTDISQFLTMDEEVPATEAVMNEEISDTYVETDDNSSAIGDLLASFALENDENNESELTEEDVESMLDAVSSPVVEESANYDQDVKDLLKLFTDDEDLSDIQDMLDKNDNGEALDESLLDLPDVEVFQLEEDVEESEEEAVPKSGILGKLVNGFSNIFKRKKKQNTDEEISGAQEDATQFEAITTESEIDLANIDEISLLDAMADDDVEELVLDDDMSDIEMLLSGGALQGSSESDETEESDDEKEASDNKKARKKKKDKKGKKDKKETIFSKVLNMLTEEIETQPKGQDGVPEAGETGITNENRDILEQLSKEDKKKAKLEKKNAKKNGGKKSSKKGDDKEDDDAKGKKAKKPKKEKKKREKKEKPRKAEVVSKPEKKLPKKRVLSVLVLCFSILAAVLILENVVSKTDNLKEAEYAYDTGDYTTCFANLNGVDRDEEEEALYQKSFVILSVQRKLDSYYNFMQMNNEVEALNSLLEGVAEYRKQEAVASEWGVQGQILAIYQTICEKLQEYGLTEADVDEILGYESKVTYTKRLDSIVNGTPFAIEDMMEGFGISEPQPFEDVLPWEEDFLPEDTAAVTAEQMEVLDEETVSEDPYVEQHGQTVVVGSNPVDISGSSQDDFGGQNVGSGNTDVSIEVDGGNAVVSDM